MNCRNRYSRAALLFSTALCLSSVYVVNAQEAEPEEDAQTEERQLETVVIRGQFIPEPQRNTAQVATFLSAEDLARQGDSNAALALTRLSGISIVGERFAFIRGLGDRYSSALLNGSPLPSPEPLRRTVPLDLFPSNILDGASVQKTFSANYPGEFGGGLIDLKTLRQPREDFLEFKLGIGGNTVTTFQDGIFVSGSDLDVLGFDDGLRDIPDPLAAALASGQSINSFSPGQVEVIGESLTNSPLTVIQQGNLSPNFDGSITAAKQLNLGAVEVGFVGAVGFDAGWETQEATRQFVGGDVLGNDFDTFETSYNTTLNALGSTTFNWAEDQEVQLTTLYVHDTSKQAQIDTGIDFNAQGSTGQIFDEFSGFYERQLIFGQLRGEHGIAENLTFGWRGAIAQSTRDAPYERFLRRFINDDGVPAYLVANSASIRFSELTDDIYSVGSELEYVFDYGNLPRTTLTTGFDFSATDRLYEFLGLRFAGGNSLPEDVQIARPDFLFSPDNIDPNRFVLQEVTTPNDSYEGALDVYAAFTELDVEVTSFLRATLGLRYEDAEQTVNTFNRFGQQGAETVNISNDYFLPAISLTWNFADDLQLRLAYSETVARPQFRELALSQYFDPESERSYRGNNGLIDSNLTSYDARIEYYLGRNQFVTLAGFYKDIENPIEEVQFETSTFVFETTFLNSPKAELLGGEFEYRTRFDLPSIGVPYFKNKEGLFSVNYTYTSSEVQAEAGQFIFDPISRGPRDATLFGIDGSDLVGTPEHIVNLQAGWESDVEQFTVLLGWVDDRILQRGIESGSGGNTLPNIIDSPGVQLDIVYNRDFTLIGQDLKLGLSARNLLDTRHEEFQISGSGLGRTEFNTYDRGVSFSASLTAKF